MTTTIDPAFLVRLRDELDHPVWTVARSAFKSVRGYADPHICEISPMQYAYLSQRQKNAYDEKRRGDWDSSASGAEEYARLVIEAWDAHAFELASGDVHRDARDAVSAERSRRAEAAEKADALAAREALKLSEDELVVGLEVFHPIYRETVIAKVNRKSVVLRCASGTTIKCDPYFLQRRAS